MVVAETMAAIALAKGAVSGVKSVIDTCKDISEISGQIDQMFHAHEQVHKKSSAKGNKEWNTYLTQKLKDGEEAEGESMSDITAEIIEKKQIEEQLLQMQRMLNRRFGPDTWNDILDLRAKRKAENKIKRKKAKEEYLERREVKRKKTIYWLHQIGNTLLLVGVVFIYLNVSYIFKC